MQSPVIQTSQHYNSQSSISFHLCSCHTPPTCEPGRVSGHAWHWQINGFADQNLSLYIVQSKKMPVCFYGIAYNYQCHDDGGQEAGWRWSTFWYLFSLLNFSWDQASLKHKPPWQTSETKTTTSVVRATITPMKWKKNLDFNAITKTSAYQE